MECEYYMHVSVVHNRKARSQRTSKAVVEKAPNQGRTNMEVT